MALVNNNLPLKQSPLNEFDESSALYVDNNGAEQIPMTPVQIQQEYFENLGDADWVKYEKNQRYYLLQNVAFALFGSPSVEGDLNNARKSTHPNLEGYTTRQAEQVMKVFEKLCEQSKYSYNDDIVMSILLVVCARPKPLKFYQIEPPEHWWDLHRRTDCDIWCTAVFRVRKCVPTTVGAKGCRVYIDDNARVYNDWDSYLKNNTLPKCVIIVPLNGEYTGEFNESDKTFAVKLTVSGSPALGVKARVLSTADTANTLASVAALGVLGAAALTPVAPVLLGGAVVATLTTGVYGLVRSSMHLHDRRTHEQTISPTDSEARNSWLNIAASSVGLAAGAASTLLSKSAAAGTNLTKTGQALAVSVEVLRHANLVTGGAGVLNSLVHIVLKYRDHGENPTPLELFQFASATLFFCNAVVSNRTAQNIIEEAQANTINEYRTTLRSNRHRKIFDKISAESRRIQGTIQGNAEVIKGIQNIANKDQYFADVLKINKDVNQHKLRISMTSDGQVNLNGQYKFNPSDLYGVGREQRSQLFTNIGPSTGGPPNVPTRLTPTTTAVSSYTVEKEDEPSMIVGIHPGEILRLGSLLIRVSSSGTEGVASLLENLSQDVYDNLMNVSLNLLSKLVPEDIAKLKLLSPDQDLIQQVVEFVFNYMKHKRPFGETNEDDGIQSVLKEFFQDGRIRQETILSLKDRLLGWMQEETDRRSRINPNKKQTLCEVCKGIRYA